MSVVADLFALAEAWRQVTFAGALITIISLASWSYRTWIFIMQYVMLCIHACNVCPRLCYLLTPSHMLLSSQVVGHWAPFWSGNCALFNFFWLKRSKKQVCIHSLHWGTKGLLSLNCFFLWWTGTWVWGDPQPSVFISVSCPLTCTQPGQLNIGVLIFATWLIKAQWHTIPQAAS
jgi:hypothetical protein